MLLRNISDSDPTLAHLYDVVETLAKQKQGTQHYYETALPLLQL